MLRGHLYWTLHTRRLRVHYETAEEQSLLCASLADRRNHRGGTPTVCQHRGQGGAPGPPRQCCTVLRPVAGVGCCTENRINTTLEWDSVGGDIREARPFGVRKETERPVVWTPRLSPGPTPPSRQASTAGTKALGSLSPRGGNERIIYPSSLFSQKMWITQEKALPETVHVNYSISELVAERLRISGDSFKLDWS